MAEIVQKLPEYDSVMLALITDYYRNYDPRTVADFLKDKVQVSIYTLMNKQLRDYLQLEQYHAVQNEIVTCDMVLDVDPNADASFHDRVTTLDYLHPSGVTVRLTMDQDQVTNDVDVEIREYITIGMTIDGLLRKALEKIISKLALNYPILTSLELETWQKDGIFHWQLRDTNMRDYIYHRSIRLLMC